MGPRVTHDLDARERRFYAATLRRGVAQSSLVKGLVLSVCASWTLGLVALIDSPSSFGARLAFCLGFACLFAAIVAALHARQRHVRDALLAIDRCGDCGHKLRGTNRPVTRGLCTKTCNECGTTWTDLQRRDSINTLYGYA